MNKSIYQISKLRCEGLVDPLGIDITRPNLSWQMIGSNGGAKQKAYQVICATTLELLTENSADLWNSEKVRSEQSQYIKYDGITLLRKTHCYWKVRVWDEKGVTTEWSEPASWSYFDLAKNADWRAKWITDESSSPWFCQSVECGESIDRSTVYVNALGYFQLYINGERVSNDEFTPHIGQYDKRTFCISYDLSEFLKMGKNTITIWMGSGWNKTGAGIETEPCVRAQIEIHYKSGDTEILGTDENWLSMRSYLSYRGKWCWNQFGGEEHNGEQEIHNKIIAPTFDDTWPKAKLAKNKDVQVSAEMLQRSRVIETLQAKSIIKLKNNAWLIDMGKAITGIFEIHLPKGSAGHTISITFGDRYDANEDGSIGELNHFNQMSQYICHGRGKEVFKGRFNYASCQYILITDAPEGEISVEDVKGYFISLDLPKTSSFECSDQTLNSIYKMMEHTLCCLMLGGYQVDCHSRERYGYGGDGHSSLDTTLSMFRSDTLYRKWTQDWTDGQKPDGELSYTSPFSGHGGGPFWCGFLPAATLKHYHHYGDLELVKRNYPAIKKWLELAQSKYIDAKQEKFCGGWYLGDWASPEGIDDKSNAETFIHAYMPYVLKQAAELADSLAYTSDATQFRNWAKTRGVDAFKNFYNPVEKVYGSGDQVTYILPLIAGIVPEDQIDSFFAKFEKNFIHRDKGHLQTGLSGTYMMVQYLQSIDRHDLIYLFASKTSHPSWGYMLEQGATATWEHWCGKASRIHNCYNSIGSWFVQGLAGIRPDTQKPGFKNAWIKPAFIKELDFVNGSHDSIYGKISSRWNRENKSIKLNIVIPANSTATIELPLSNDGSLQINGEILSECTVVNQIETKDASVVFTVVSGMYDIVFNEE